MAQRILVPLDGSALAEQALAEALKLARLSTSTVYLLHVVPPIESVIGEGEEMAIDQQWESRKIHALEYLKSVCARPEWQHMNVDVEVEMGPPAEAILDFARAHNIDWIVMSTHGRGGLERWVYGSVADKVLRGADRTVVLVRAERMRRHGKQVAAA